MWRLFSMRLSRWFSNHQNRRRKRRKGGTRAVEYCKNSRGKKTDNLLVADFTAWFLDISIFFHLGEAATLVLFSSLDWYKLWWSVCPVCDDLYIDNTDYVGLCTTQRFNFSVSKNCVMYWLDRRRSILWGTKPLPLVNMADFISFVLILWEARPITWSNNPCLYEL